MHHDDQALEKLLTPDEFEDLTGIPKTTQASMRSRGALPYVNLSGRIPRYEESAIREWIASRVESHGALADHRLQPAPGQVALTSSVTLAQAAPQVGGSARGEPLLLGHLVAKALLASLALPLKLGGQSGQSGRTFRVCRSRARDRAYPEIASFLSALSACHDSSPTWRSPIPLQ